MKRDAALDLIDRFKVDVASDFHALPFSQVARVLAAADVHKYRAPLNAYGSRARYFHTALRRAVGRER